MSETMGPPGSGDGASGPHQVPRRRQNVAAIKGKRRGGTKTPGGVASRFQKGHRAHPSRVAINPVEEMDRIAKETLSRLKRRRYEMVEDEEAAPDPETGLRPKKKIEVYLDASRGNAIANVLRVRLDIFAQYKAGEELQRQQREIEELRAHVERMATGGRAA